MSSPPMSSPRSCRILVISSSIAQGKALAERLAASLEPPAAGFKDDTTVELPWTISNKYYTAPVHFLVAPAAAITHADTHDVPACIFVFSLAEPFEAAFAALAARLAHAEFEVALAVSVPAPALAAEAATDDERDAFFGAHGFEYVNGHSPRAPEHPTHGERERTGVPGISRVADALSTVLWPSMVRRRAALPPRPPDDNDSDNDNDNDNDDGLRGDTCEMAALERWLEDGATDDDDDDDDDGDPWAGAPRSRSPAGAPGFDDNFSDFVSAAAAADPALPSRADVAAASRRIFAAGSAEHGDEDASQAPFDLSRVLGALEAMKEEIAGIADEDERRTAAAKVALGLVYGLEEG